MDQKDIEMKNFMRDWMYDVGKHQLPDLADFRPMWEEAQKLNIPDYHDYLKYKENPLKYYMRRSSQEEQQGEDRYQEIKLKSNNSPIFNTNNKMIESQNSDIYISPDLKYFINNYSDLIQNEEWEKLINKFSVHSLNNYEVKEFYRMMENSGIYIPLEIKEITLINKVNKIFAKLRGNKNLYYILDEVKTDQGYDVNKLLNDFIGHTYGFNKKEIKNILFKYKDKLIIPIEEIKL